jgi:hypothetical protein
VGRVIARFVAMDAPGGTFVSIAIVAKAWWSRWSPYTTMLFASGYMWQLGTRGAYAYNVWDIAIALVFGLPGSWSVYAISHWAWFNVVEMHNWLVWHLPSLCIGSML